MPSDKRGSPQAASDGVQADVVRTLPWQGSAESLLSLASRAAPELAAVVYDRFAEDVHRVVYRVLGPDVEHEDVVQQTFLEVLRGIQRVREPERLRSWVLSVAINTARGHLRSRRLKFWLEPDSATVELWAEPEGADRELVLATYEALATLSANDRIAFSLRYLEGYQVQEVAQLTAASLATVHRRLARAEAGFRRQARASQVLREYLRRCEAEPQ